MRGTRGEPMRPSAAGRAGAADRLSPALSSGHCRPGPVVRPNPGTATACTVVRCLPPACCPVLSCRDRWARTWGRRRPGAVPAPVPALSPLLAVGLAFLLLWSLLFLAGAYAARVFVAVDALRNGCLASHCRSRAGQLPVRSGPNRAAQVLPAHLAWAHLPPSRACPFHSRIRRMTRSPFAV